MINITEFPEKAVQYMYEAHLAFLEISSGVYAIGKNKDPFSFSKDHLYTADDVVAAMNHKDLPVLICASTLDRPRYANFKLSTDKEGN